MNILPQRPLSIAEIDAAYLQLCGIAPRLADRLMPARALLLSGAFLDDSAQVHFPLGAIYGLADDRCSCAHIGPSLCVHQLAMRIRRVAIGRVLLREVGESDAAAQTIPC